MTMLWCTRGRGFLVRHQILIQHTVAHLCHGDPSHEQDAIDMEGRADVKEAAATRFAIMTKHRPHTGPSESERLP